MIKKATLEDAEILAALAIQMWTDHVPENMAEEFRELVINEEAVCFIKCVGEKPIGFAQCQLRHDYVEEQRVLQSVIWKGFLLRKKIGSTDMLQNF